MRLRRYRSVSHKIRGKVFGSSSFHQRKMINDASKILLYNCSSMDSETENATLPWLWQQFTAYLDMLVWHVTLQTNRRLSSSVFYPLLIAYVVLVIFGVLANALIIILICRQSSRSFPSINIYRDYKLNNCFISRHQFRHLLMINLSVSNLLLCLVTMPLTFMELVSFSWPLGNYPLLCKLAGSIYCSTLTIASIAADRDQLIGFVEMREQPMDWAASILLLVGIWSGSLLLACPLYLFRTLKHFPLNEELGFTSVDFCIEEWPEASSAAQLIYSVTSSLFQFLMPAIIIVLARVSICACLRRHSRPVRPKTHNLLSAIAMTFAFCWTPLNLFNLLDAFFPAFLSDYQQVKLTVYAVCHLTVMSSACINPILYGWLNHYLRKYLINNYC